ncbi:hypothetical protein BH11ARM2_BH11ARM2_03430 [soil metagenome]
MEPWATIPGGTLHTFAVLAALSFLLAIQGAESGLPGLRVGEGWGANLGLYDLTQTDETRLRESGLRWVRRETAWSQVETKKGVYDFTPWDKLLASLNRSGGVRPVFILDGGNDLYGKGAPRSPEARAAFVKFVEAALARFKDKGGVWELWNEPNGIDALHPDEYAALAKDVADAFARTAPRETLVGPALAGIDLGYLEGLAKTGVLKRFAGITLHPDRSMPPESFMADVARVRTLLGRYGSPDLPVLSSEWGYSATGGMEEEKQADYAVRQHLVLLAAGAPMAIWDDWRGSGPDPSGLLQPNSAPKPVYQAIHVLTRDLGGFRYRTRLAAERPDDWVLLFEKGDRPGLAAWTTAEPHEIEIYPGTKLKLTTRPQAVVPERRSRFLDAALALPSVPPFVAYDGPDEVARLLRSVQSSLPAGTTMEVRLNLPVIGPKRVEFRAGEIGSGEAIDKFLQSLPRSSDPVRLRLAIPLEGGSLRQETFLQSSRPLNVEIRPKSDGTGLLAVRATGGFEGTLKIVRGESTEEKSLILADGEEATFDIPSLDMPTIAVLSEKGRVVLVTDSARFIPVPLTTVTASVDGDEKVYGKVTVTDAPAEAGYPNAKEVAYDLRKGSKVVLGRLPEPLIVVGRPVSYGVWVNGDGVGATLLMRFNDATGQTFQPEGVPIDWKGWHFVRFSMRGDTGGHGGGANDGVVHLPVRVTAPFVIDNPGGKGVAGSIRVASASISTHTE